MKKLYVVALQLGGLMEDPDFHYEDFDIIEAETSKEAKAIYDRDHNCSYFYGKVLGTMEEVE